MNDAEDVQDEGLSAEEAEQLPDRESMSVIGDVTIPLDPTVAADVLLGQEDSDSAAADAGD